MRHTKYIGQFKSAEGHIYELTVHCDGFLQAFILLTADAIRSGRHYQLNTITDDKKNVMKIDDIVGISPIFHSVK